jgi:hypothetical protein
MPLATKTASRRRKAVSARTRRRLGHSGWRLIDAAGPAPTSVRATSAAPSSKGGMTQARAATPALASVASRPGKVAARMTPSRPQASRAAVRRVRQAELPPTSAPHAW